MISPGGFGRPSGGETLSQRNIAAPHGRFAGHTFDVEEQEQHLSFRGMER